MTSEDRFGQDWNNGELDLIVADYFSMLDAELKNEPYNKSEHRRGLIAKIGRTEGSVERKHQNISAVLQELVMPTITGYKPLPNFQKTIIDAIDRYLTQTPKALQLEPSLTGFSETPTLFVEPAPKNSQAHLSAQPRAGSP